MAHYDHQRWVKQVLDSSDGQFGQGLLRLQDHHDCRFGLWYDGHGRTNYAHLAEFSALEALHARMHEIGLEIVRLNHAGQLAAASALQARLLLIQEQMQLQLENLQQAVAEQYSCLPYGMHCEDADA